MAIDVHGHITSPELLRRLPMPPSLGDIEGMIEQKAAVGITTTIVGSPVGAGTMVPVPGLDNYAQPLDRLDAFHEWVAETVRAHPGRLRAYVYVNPYGDEREMELAARRLAQDEFVGLIANSSVRRRYLDDGRADAFFALAARRQVPILLHPPAEPAAGQAVEHLGLIEHVVRPCDVTLGVAAIVFAGWLDKYPGLRIIAATGGGGLPLLVDRLDLAYRRAAGGPKGNGKPPIDLHRPPAEALRAVYVDTATPSAAAVAAAVRTFGVDRVLFGTDSPPLSSPLKATLDLVAGLELSPAEAGRVLSGNAQHLFGLDRSPAGAAETKSADTKSAGEEVTR